MAPLTVLGVSLGSSRRDYELEWRWEGGVVRLTRRGTDGSLRRAEELLREYDGRVGAFGLGGVNLYLTAGRRSYVLPAGYRLASVPVRTPVCDGRYFKTWWEPRAFVAGCARWGLDFRGKRILFSSALDRWPLARAMELAGARVLVGDAAFALRFPLLFPGLRSFYPAAVAGLPLLRHLPLSFLYPLGQRRGRRGGRGDWLFRGVLLRGVEVLAGDFHFLRSRLPDRLDGKWVVTGGLQAPDVEALRQRGAGLVLQVGPVAGAPTEAAAGAAAGLGLSANMAEAMVVAAMRAGRTESPVESDFLRFCDELGFAPFLLRFGASSTPRFDAPLSVSEEMK